MKPIRIVILAKAPLPGLAKTRLIPVLGRAGSARLARKLLNHTLEQAMAADIGPVELCVAPTVQHPVWNTLTLPVSVDWSEQGSGDLGERLAKVSRRVTGNGEAVLLIGTDCPGLSAGIMQAAAEALSCHDSCLIPVSDGGYALLGLHKHLPSLFTGIPWSTPVVAQLTCQRIMAEGWTLEQFESLHDIDEPRDLQWLPAEFQGNPLSAQHGL